MRPLDDILILDLTRLLPGAAATMSLASFGAEVIKIEQPGLGDPARDIEGGSSIFAETNRGKKSVAIDLKDKRGKQLFLQLATKVDVVVESFRPGVMHRLGIDYSQLAPINPRLIFASLTGYGQDGGDAQMAGHDINYMAMSGVLHLIASTQTSPMLPEIQIADLAGGAVQLTIGILLALQSRQKTGRGQKIDVSMVNAMSPLLTVPLATLRSQGRTTMRGQELLSGGYACYNLYRASDGQWLAVGALEPEFWGNLCRRLGCEDLIEDQFSSAPRQREIKLQIAQIFARDTAQRWFNRLRYHDCCVTPMRSVQEATAEGYFDDKTPAVALSDTPANVPLGCPPAVGEHSFEILKQFGVPESEVRVLQHAGVIQLGSRQSVPAASSVGETLSSMVAIGHEAPRIAGKS